MNRIVQILGIALNLMSISGVGYAQELISTSPAGNYIIDQISNSKEVYLDLADGEYYALIIGVNYYSDKNIVRLDNPVSDGQELKRVLQDHYHFEANNVFFLENPLRVDLLHVFEKLNEKLTASDNLLIYFAGHGFWDDESRQGYWLLTDAIKMDRSTWVLNESILRFSETIEAHHILLISDACFSGGIFKTRGSKDLDTYEPINKLYQYPSRKAMTSGALTTVPDKSVFTETLIQRLKQNKSKYMTAERLFFSLKNKVILDGMENQIPQYGEISIDGNKGGDFVFIREN